MADRGGVLAHVLKQGLTLTTIGIGAGLAGAFALNPAWRASRLDRNAVLRSD